MLALSGAAALYVRNAGMTVGGREVSRATVAAADAVGAAVLAGVSAVSDSVGLGRIVAADAADAAPAPAACRCPRRQDERRNGASGRRGRSKHPGRGVESLPPRTVVAYEVPDDLASTTEALARQTEHAWIHRPMHRSISVVYTPGADGVSPPVGVRPQLPRQLPPTVDPAISSRIELVIARDGSVESARLLGNRRDVLGGMFLSAAKAWEFQPATKDGVAVRYRKTILVSFE